MSFLDLLLVVPVTILSAPRAEDPYGRDEADWDNAAETEADVWIEPTAGYETVAGMDQLRLDARAWLPPGTPITGRDRVVVVGSGAEAATVFEVIGEPERRLAPWSSTEHHVRVDLRAVDNR